MESKPLPRLRNVWEARASGLGPRCAAEEPERARRTEGQTDSWWEDRPASSHRRKKKGPAGQSQIVCLPPHPHLSPEAAIPHGTQLGLSSDPFSHLQIEPGLRTWAATLTEPGHHDAWSPCHPFSCPLLLQVLGHWLVVVPELVSVGDPLEGTRAKAPCPCSSPAWRMGVGCQRSRKQARPPALSS